MFILTYDFLGPVQKLDDLLQMLKLFFTIFYSKKHMENKHTLTIILRI